MSIPVSQCMLYRAAREGGLNCDRFLEIMRYNLAHGSMTMVPCSCTPPCVATPKQLRQLEELLNGLRKKGK